MSHDSVWAPIRYRDFWDVPRIFLVSYRGQLFLFDCPFDETLEDFPDLYHVYVMPALGEDELSGSWAGLALKAIRHVGDVPIAQVRFDQTKRQGIDPSLLDDMTSRKSVAG
jgi:hypothetical protein